jgi:hypothetical protein
MTPYTGYHPPAAPMPYGPPPLPPIPGPRLAKRSTAIVLGVVAAVLFLVGAAFAVLYLSAADDHDAAVVRLADKETELDRVSDQLAASEDARDQAEQANDNLETTRTDLAACVDPVQRYLWDGLVGAERSAVFDQWFTACG